MAQKPFANDPFGHPSKEATAGSSTTPVDNTTLESQAVEDLLRNRRLTTPCGRLHEYAVETALTTNRHAWHYRCCVVQYGIEVEERFPAIFVDRTAAITREPITEELRRQFAAEAVKKHFTRSAEVEAYLTSLLPPPTRHRSRWVLGGIMLSIVCVAAYVMAGTQLGWWPWHIQLRPPSANPPPSPKTPRTVRWDRNSLLHQSRSGQGFSLMLPTLERTPPNVPVDVTLEAPDHMRHWLRLEQSPLRLSGIAPSVMSDVSYTFFVQAKVQGETAHKLRIDFSITREAQPAPPTPPSKVDEMRLLERIQQGPR